MLVKFPDGPSTGALNVQKSSWVTINIPRAHHRLSGEKRKEEGPAVDLKEGLQVDFWGVCIPRPHTSLEADNETSTRTMPILVKEIAWGQFKT